ncbi:MAG TPA: arylesterase [Elusimicrobiota bacterium]|nr:arylesterase [Elusimicrobiota bacterium]
MNKILAAGLLFLAACGRNAPPPPPASPPPALHILCFGDSLTAGKDLPNPEHQSYPALLEKRLKEAGYSVRVTNAGQSGDTTFEALARLDFSLEDRPDLVVVCLGSNDVFQGKNIADTETNLREILRRARAAGARTILCQMRIYINFGFGWAARYEKIFPRVAEDTGATLAPFPLEGVAAHPSKNLSDGIHPNAEGYGIFVDNIYPTVEKAVKKRLKEKQ